MPAAHHRQAAGGAAFAGAITFALLALTTSGLIARVWSVGIACGLGGLTGGYLGARLQPPIPDRGLTLLLGILAIALSITYILRPASADMTRTQDLARVVIRHWNQL